VKENEHKKLEEVKRKVENVTHLKRGVLEYCVDVFGYVNIMVAAGGIYLHV
jgi:hypothetical protein